MHVDDAIRSRHSVRRLLPTPARARMDEFVSFHGLGLTA